jgi:dTMP kinase
MLITFEGIDCCGKTTQVKLLNEKLTSRRFDVIVLREPGGTPVSERIREILLDKNNVSMIQITELFLFSASRAQLVSEVIKPALADKKIVLCDRYVDSTTVYQGYGRGLTLGAVKTINRVATMDVVPTKTFFIDITVEEMHERRRDKRKSIDRMEMGTEEFYGRVRKGYYELVREDPHRFVTIDGKRSIEEIHSLIWTDVQKLLPGSSTAV